MASLPSSSLPISSSLNKVNAAIHLPKLPQIKIPSSKSTNNLQLQNLNLKGFSHKTKTRNPLEIDHASIVDDCISNSKVTLEKLYAILESISDRIEMHKNIGQQRDNWNSLLLNSTNMITLAAATMAAIAVAGGGDGVLPLKVSSTLLFGAATGISLVMSKIQPSQLAEEQRNATRLFKQLHSQIQTLIAMGNPKEEDVENAIEKVIALDRAYPLPLLNGAMLDKFPEKFEPAVWWPQTGKRKSQKMQQNNNNNKEINGWSEELKMEIREVIEVMKRKDIEDYDRLGNMALKFNKTLATWGPLLTGMAAVGSAFVGKGSMVDVVTLVAASLGAVVNTVEHGGQVGMVVEMYRNCGGFFKKMEELESINYEERENNMNGEIFEMKMALQLGRSVSQLRELASKSRSYRSQGIPIDEFASKLF